MGRKRVAGYIRVTKADKEEAVSLITQKDRIMHFYEDVEIVKIYDKDAGKTAFVKEKKIEVDVLGDQLIATFDLSARPALLELLNDANNGLFEELLITRWDRWSRSAILQNLLLLHLNRKGIEVTPTDDSKDRLVREISSVLSEEEPRRVSKRLNLTLKRKFDQGIIVGKLPFGYKWDKRKKHAILDKNDAETVKKAFELTANNHKYDKICESLKLPVSTYYRIIKNEVYTGKVVFRGKSKKGLHEAIIDDKLFEKVNA